MSEELRQAVARVNRYLAYVEAYNQEPNDPVESFTFSDLRIILDALPLSPSPLTDGSEGEE